MAVIALTYHSISCVCDMCLHEDSRLGFLTTNGFKAEVKFLDARDN